MDRPTYGTPNTWTAIRISNGAVVVQDLPNRGTLIGRVGTLNGYVVGDAKVEKSVPPIVPPLSLMITLKSPPMEALSEWKRRIASPSMDDPAVLLSYLSRLLATNFRCFQENPAHYAEL